MKTNTMEREIHPDVRENFTRREIRRSRCLLRRLNFLREQVRGHENPSGYVLLEIESLEWVLTDVGFLAEGVSGNEVK